MMRTALLVLLARDAASLRLPGCSRPFAPARLSAPVRAVAGGGGDGMVDLLEESTGKILSCFVADTVEVDGQIYAALYPADAPVTLGFMQGGRLQPLDGGEEEGVMAAAMAACATVGAELHDTPVVLTASGEAIEAEIDLDASREPGPLPADGEDEEDMVAVVDFMVDGVQHFVLRLLDPVYVVGKRSADKKSYVVPSDEEMDEVEDLVQQLVEDIEEQFDDEFDDDEENEIAPYDPKKSGFAP